MLAAFRWVQKRFIRRRSCMFYFTEIFVSSEAKEAKDRCTFRSRYRTGSSKLSNGYFIYRWYCTQSLSW